MPLFSRDPKAILTESLIAAGLPVTGISGEGVVIFAERAKVTKEQIELAKKVISEADLQPRQPRAEADIAKELAALDDKTWRELLTAHMARQLAQSPDLAKIAGVMVDEPDQSARPVVIVPPEMDDAAAVDAIALPSDAPAR